MIKWLSKNNIRLVDVLAILFILLFFVSGVATLRFYGMSWDEGLGNFFFGERYLHYLFTFQEKFLDFKAELPMHSEHALNLFPSTWRNNPEIFPAAADIPSAASMYLFSYTLGWLDPVDGFHLFSLLLLSIFLILFYFFAAQAVGKTVAFFSVCLLVVFPRLWGDMHFNQKDIPEMVFFGLTLMAYWKWFQRADWKWAVLAGIAGGAALGVKANALFLPFMLILGAWPIRLREIWAHLRKTFFHYLVMIGTALLTYFLSWPFLYSNPLNAFKYFRAISTQGGRLGSTTWIWQPLQITLATMPEIMILLLGFGLAIGISWAFKKRGRIYRYLLVWCLFPILRISLPPSINFDGIRHFLEFLPAAALLAGLGASWLIRLASRWKDSLRAPATALVVLLIISNTYLNFMDFGLYQHIYFNRTTGGLAGGKELFGAAEATDYWAISYRQGMEWLNQNAPLNSVLHLPVGGHLVDLTAPLWLRPDIRLIGEESLTQERSEGRAVYIMMVTRPDFYNSVAEICINERTPEYQIKVQEIPTLNICRW